MVPLATASAVLALAAWGASLLLRQDAVDAYNYTLLPTLFLLIRGYGLPVVAITAALAFILAVRRPSWAVANLLGIFALAALIGLALWFDWWYLAPATLVAVPLAFWQMRLRWWGRLRLMAWLMPGLALLLGAVVCLDIPRWAAEGQTVGRLAWLLGGLALAAFAAMHWQTDTASRGIFRKHLPLFLAGAAAVALAGWILAEGNRVWDPRLGWGYGRLGWAFALLLVAVLPVYACLWWGRWMMLAGQHRHRALLASIINRDWTLQNYFGVLRQVTRRDDGKTISSQGLPRCAVVHEDAKQPPLLPGIVEPEQLFDRTWWAVSNRIALLAPLLKWMRPSAPTGHAEGESVAEPPPGIGLPSPDLRELLDEAVQREWACHAAAGQCAVHDDGAPLIEGLRRYSEMDANARAEAWQQATRHFARYVLMREAQIEAQHYLFAAQGEFPAPYRPADAAKRLAALRPKLAAYSKAAARGALPPSKPATLKNPEWGQVFSAYLLLWLEALDRRLLTERQYRDAPDVGDDPQDSSSPFPQPVPPPQDVSVDLAQLTCNLLTARLRAFEEAESCGDVAAEVALWQIVLHLTKPSAKGQRDDVLELFKALRSGTDQQVARETPRRAKQRRGGQGKAAARLAGDDGLDLALGAWMARALLRGEWFPAGYPLAAFNEYSEPVGPPRTVTCRIGAHVAGCQALILADGPMGPLDPDAADIFRAEQICEEAGGVMDALCRFRRVEDAWHGSLKDSPAVLAADCQAGASWSAFRFAAWAVAHGRLGNVAHTKEAARQKQGEPQHAAQP